MASVKLETRNEGRGLREWDYVPLSEPRVVARQIKNRYRVDEAYYPLLCESSNPLMTNGVFPFSEPVLVTYMDLDMLIAQARLTNGERKVIGWLMQGYCEADIAEHVGATADKIKALFNCAVHKIVDMNNKNWKTCGNKQYGGSC